MNKHKNIGMPHNVARSSIADITIDIAISSDSWSKEQNLSEAALYTIVENILSASFKRLDFQNVHSELSVVFTNDAEISQINLEWRNKDKATNVLSFPAFSMKPYDKIGPILGDIVIAYETVAREAMDEGKTFHDHLSHLLTHGFLHLIGFDHETEEQAEEMEQLEREILSSLAIRDPYAIV